MLAVVLVLTGAVATASARGPHVSLGLHQGRPALVVDGVPRAPLFHFSQEILDDYAQHFDAAGFRFYSCIELTSYLDLGWVGEQQYDYAKLDKVLSGFQRRLPQAYVLPKIHLWAPEWWLDKYPAERMGYDAEPEAPVWRPGDGLKHESFASRRWQHDAGEALRALVRHILDAPYADRVMGIFLAQGCFGEWLPWSWDPDHLPDSSESMRIALGQYVQRKYGGDVAALRRAWSDPDVTFETVRVPGRVARHRGDVGLFHDVARSHHVPDYRAAFQEATVDAIEHFCRIVKEESDGRLLTCVNYAYQPDVAWAAQETHHRAAARCLRSPWLDMLSAPHSYYYRDLGQHGNLRHFPESVSLHGKLFIDEADERTHLARPDYSFRLAQTMDQSRQVLRRSLANMLTYGVGMWYMDQSSGHWYDAPEFWQDFAAYQQWSDQSMKLSRTRRSEVACISALESEYVIASRTDVSAQFFVAQTEHLCRAGAPYDRFLIEDLEEDRLPDYKVYVFLVDFCLTDRQLAAIEKLKRQGRTLIWFWAPGFAGPSGLSLQRMEALTGMKLRQDAQPFAEVAVTPDLFPRAPRQFQAWRSTFGADVKQLSPRFVPQELDHSATVWGRYADTGEPALVHRDCGSWRSVYCATVPLDWSILQHIYERSGVHVYSRAGDNLMAGDRWVGLHTCTAGRKRICLPHPRPVYDVFNRRLIAGQTQEFEVDLAERETALFLLAQPEE